MTGEMTYIDQDGYDQDGECWFIHAAIARAVGGTLKPFDKYQGCYILVGGGEIVINENSPYRIPISIRGFKPIRLWIVEDDDGLPAVYREDTEEMLSFWFDDEDSAIESARILLGLEEVQ